MPRETGAQAAGTSAGGIFGGNTTRLNKQRKNQSLGAGSSLHHNILWNSRRQRRRIRPLRKVC